MKKLKEFLYDEKYMKIAIYGIVSALVVFVVGLIIYNMSTETKSAFTFIEAITAPLILGIVLAYLFSPVVSWFETEVFAWIKNDKTRRAFGVTATFVLIAMIVLFIISMLVITVTKSISAIDFKDLVDYVESLETDFSAFWSVVESKLADFNINLGDFGSSAAKTFNNISSGASTLLFANIFAIYFLLDDQIGEYWKDVLILFTSEKTRNSLKEFVADADRVFSGYIRGQFLDALLIGVMVTIALLIAGIPYAVVIGLLTAVGNLIPYVGPIVGFGSLIIVCLSEGSLAHLVIGGIVLAVVMAIDGNIINPKLLSDNVEIHPILVIVALIAGGQMGGVLGMLIAVPVAALLKQQFDKFVAKRIAKQMKQG